MSLEELMQDKDFTAKLQAAKDYEEMAELFRQQGLDTSAEALEAAVKMAKDSGESGELGEDALEAVAGGISGKWPWNAAQDRRNLIEIGWRVGYEIGRYIARW